MVRLFLQDSSVILTGYTKKVERFFEILNGSQSFLGTLRGNSLDSLGFSRILADCRGSPLIVKFLEIWKKNPPSLPPLGSVRNFQSIFQNSLPDTKLIRRFLKGSSKFDQTFPSLLLPTSCRLLETPSKSRCELDTDSISPCYID